MSASDHLPNPASLAYVEALQEAFLNDPASVPEDWRRFFESGGEPPPRGWRSGPSFRPASIFHAPAPARRLSPQALEVAILQDRVDQLIRAYRILGHMAAHVDPLGLPREAPLELQPSHYGIGGEDMEREVSIRTIPGAERRTVREVIEHLKNTYCRSIGVEYMHTDDLAARWWLRDRMEETENHIALSRDEQLRILTRLTDALNFEEFIQKKFLGSKSFSLEGAESLIPLLDMAIERAGEQAIDEIVLGMAHRGRLNVLANIVKKPVEQIFREFKDADPELHLGGGDVKYHLGHSTDWVTSSGRKIHITLCFNPSHLEFVNTVALGRLRAKQDHAGDLERRRGMTILIHGEAAFAGEGVVQETLNLSQLRGYSTGGTLHVIVNNQIGFTTSAEEGRSSSYATGVAKMLQIPIFHVNGENPEAVAQAVHLAMDFRARFQRDVVIDMYCYRRRGHNETDEPSFTQPVMYRAILEHKSVRHGYLERLRELGGITEEEAREIDSLSRERLEKALGVAQDSSHRPGASVPSTIWQGYFGGPAEEADQAATAVDRGRLAALLEAQARVPEGFRPHPKVERLLEDRKKMARGEKPIDWAAAEALALGSLSVQGCRVRMSGQDSRRGTFSQRHAVLHDHHDGHTHFPLQSLAPDQAPLEIYNSPLSEAGVMGFEYGYSLDSPDTLVIWEAQFGDFVNVAQVIIDQFLASAEVKWKRLSGLVLLLPHGFEGMGPEHSSARLERFLMLAARDNLQVAYPTSPAQCFHLLRRQALRRWRKPLVVMTPKSLLRHPQCTSALADLERGGFRAVLPDAAAAVEPARVERVLLVTGKLYYELEEALSHRSRRDHAIVRLEELYPFPAKDLAEALAPYAPGTPLVWVQEEPENMGAWRYLCIKIPEEIKKRFRFSGVSRPESSSPATGSNSSHRLEQQMLLAEAFGDDAQAARRKVAAKASSRSS